MTDAPNLRQAALDYHAFPKPGKLEVRATKPLANGRDLARAYSPGVAEACLEIKADPTTAAHYTTRANLVGVVTNGTAVLGLGNIGALASKPVMEGKAVLFKKFANIDCFDIELDQNDPEKLAELVCALEPTFGAINLEDIKAPDCFTVERICRERMNIPVFHDDQHGTAIVVGAAVKNALFVAGKKFEDIKIVSTGGGAAGIACLNMLLKLGVKRENVWLCDINGLVYDGRTEDMNPSKAEYAQKSDLRTLDDVIDGADLFLGLSGPGVLSPEMVAKMAKRPIIFALANPTPEILPDVARAVAPDAIIATGRSDFPNQVNNVLCFPFIFRGALDVGATTINEEMKLAAVTAIAELAREEPSEVAARAYGGVTETFGPKYLIPSPFDQRLILRIAPAVARAAMETGVAMRPIDDFDAYHDRLNRFVFRSGMIMKPIIAAARSSETRIIYSNGEDERVLRAAQVLLEDRLARPILIGRPSVIESRCERFGLKIRPGRDFEFINPEDDPRYRDYVDTLFTLVGRRGVTPEAARTMVRSNTTVIGALALHRGEADALICGLEGRYSKHLADVRGIIGNAPGVQDFSALSLLINSNGATFFTDTYVTIDPSAREIAETTMLAAEEIRRFGITPRAALLSASNFGSRDMASADKMRAALELLKEMAPDLEVDGEMHGDSALSLAMRGRVMPDSRLTGEANLLVFPSLDAANIALNLVKVMTDSLHVGPILLGTAKPVHILTPSVTSRGVVNMSAFAAVEAQTRNRT